MSTLLSNGISALTSFQRALSTISHNVANANTPGYSRQVLDLSARAGQAYGFGFIGAGVQVDSVRRVTDLFNFARSLDSAAELGRLGELAALAGRVDKLVSDQGTGLTGPWSKFFDAGQGVSTQPTSTAARQNLLAAGEALAARFRSLDAQFKGMESELNGKLRAGVDDANRLSAEIARLNQEIVRQRGLAGGQPPNDLLDQRERLIGELSARLGVNTVLQDDGALNVFTPSGQAMVVGTTSLRLGTVADPFSPDRLELAIETPHGRVLLNDGAIGGSLGGLLEFRRDVLDPAAAQLGRMAATLAHSFNAQHRAGVDLYGQPGGDFFTPIVPTTAGHTLNAGSAALSASLSDIAGYRGEDVVLAFDGTGWSATERTTGRAVPLGGSGTAGDPLVFNGVSVVVSGTAAPGDRFLVRPAIGAAGQLSIAVKDPARIAAASPLRASADLANVGNMSVQSLTVEDAGILDFNASHTIVFTGPNSYTIDGVGPHAYDPDAGIAQGGWRLKLEGTPVAGDSFRIAPRGAGSSDNGNARLFAVLDGRGQLDGGNLSLNGALGQLTTSVGSAARHAEYARDAQQIIDTQVRAEREAVSGVNLDEEAANLVRYQQAYQAAAQMIGTADTLFQTLLAAVRR
ncbi:MAG: flagellar hook-associated protein FlgK [Rehaibacterium terrae]|uniref:flagellar hook-associated protein FlgK n=1 Tax=Rehaibacterium terrae TaxID=1341696 RepID=UPI003919B5A8